MAGSLLVAMAIEAAIGWPRQLHAWIGHPVTWIGWLVDQLDGWLNRPTSSGIVCRLLGALVMVSVVGVAGIAGLAVERILPSGIAGLLITGLIAWPLVAARSMYDHVLAVAKPLAASDLTAARGAVAMIVGRNPEQLDEAGVARASLESLAENTSDGIVAPVFWGLVLGLPGIAAYKAINTLDSMIGHRTPRHEAFGWASARIDDLANLIPARLTGLTFAIISSRPRAAFSCMMSDARKHRSPNAGWPEAALAGALGVRLSGPRAYPGGVSEEPWLNAEARDPNANDISKGLAVFVRAMLVLAMVLAILAAI